MKHLYTSALLCITALYCFSQTDLSTPLIKNTGAFAENMGQVIDQEGRAVTGVLVKGGVPGLDIYLTETGLSFVMLQYEEDPAAEAHPVYATPNKKFKVHCSRVDIDLQGAAISKSQLEFSNPETYKAGYYYGETKVPAVAMYKQVKVKNVYPGIDWVWKINANGLAEYDFIVHSGANSNSIQMKYRYADLNAKQNQLFITTPVGTLREGDLKASADNKSVTAAYSFQPAEKLVSFNIGNYDNTKDLTIDPPLSLLWSAQYGGTFADGLRGVATDTLGNAYLVGYSTSVNFPFLFPGGNSYCDSSFGGNSDAILLKVAPNQTLLWATYMGGSGNDFANSVAVARNGNIFVTGGAQAGFPTAYMFNTYIDNTASGQDIFVAEFSPNLNLLWSTFYGGNGTEEALKVFYEESLGRLWLTGYTNSGNTFPVKNQGSFTKLPTNGYDNPFLLEFSTVFGVPLAWATGFPDSANAYGTSVVGAFTHCAMVGFTSSPKLNYFGGNPAQLSNNGGVDGFIVHFASSGNAEFESMLGGHGNDYLLDICAGFGGVFYITGRTNSIDFPHNHVGPIQFHQDTLAGSYDAFITQYINDTVVSWSTYYGGTDLDAGTGITVDVHNVVLMTGYTFSNNFPVDSPKTGGYYQPVNKGASDGFIASFTQHGVRTYSTYKGDSCYEYPADIAAGPTGDFYVCGEGLFACNKSLPDSANQLTGSSNGFCWGFGAAPTQCLPVGVSVILNPCPTINNGVAQVSYSSGIPPYSVFWSSYETTDTAFNLSPSINPYVYVSDSVGCSGDAELELSPLTLHFNTVSGNCYTNGSATFFNLQGNPPYTYQWQNGFPNQNTISAPPGYYPVTVTDSRNCTVPGAVYIPSSDVIDTTIYVLRYPRCGYNNGILMAYSLGHGPVNVEWYDSSNNFLGVFDTLFNVSPGTYYINADNCVNNQIVTPNVTLSAQVITETLTADIPEVYLGCQQSVALTANVTTTYYTSNACYFQWSNGHQGFGNGGYSDDVYINNLGVYSVTVTDGNGCTASASVNITEHDYIDTIDCHVIQPSCFNAHDGSIDVFATANMYWATLDYHWSGTNLNPPYTSYDIYDLGPGTYTVTVSNPTTGCHGVYSFNLAVPGSEDLEIQSLPLGCGPNTGYAEVTNYNSNFVPVDWYDGSFNLVSNLSAVFNLMPGTYYVEVNNWYNTCVLIGEEPDSVHVQIDSLNYLCSHGLLLKANVFNGTAPYSYTWNQPQWGGANITAALAGPYSVTVTDYLGCSVSASANYGFHQPLSLSFITHPRCNSDSNDVTVIPHGGYPPYGGDTGVHTYNVGTQFVTVYDSAGCTVTYNVEFQHHNYLNVTYTTVPPVCNTPGSITITATGGTAPYAGTGTFTLNGGASSFIVSDNAGCRDTVRLNITQGIVMLNYSVAPHWCDNHTATITLQPSGGIAPYSGDTGQLELPAGSYNFSVTDNGGCTGTANLTLTEPAALLASYTATPILCNGNTSTVNVVASGGNQPYSGDIGTHLEFAGNYTYIVTDAIGCADTLPISITQPAALSLTYSTVDASCNGAQGSVSVNAVGGTSPYTYPNGQGGPVYAGGYNYIVIDNNNCVDSVHLVVNQPTELLASYTATPVLCNGGTSTVVVSATGGNPAYSGATGTHVVPAGTYNYVVYDQASCTDSLTIVINQPAALSFTTATQGVLNCNATAVPVVVTAAGGTGPYTNSGNFTIATDSIYNWQVTDNNGCQADSSFSVVLPALNVAIEGAPDTVCRNSNVHLSSTGNYMAVWNGSVTDSVFNLSNMQNSAVVTMAAYAPNNICRVTDTVSITVVTCVGIPETANNPGIKVYPNPATNLLHLFSESALENKAVIRIFAADGKLVAEQEMNPGEKAADIACDKLAAGAYVLEFVSEAKRTYYRVEIVR